VSDPGRKPHGRIGQSSLLDLLEHAKNGAFVPHEEALQCLGKAASLKGVAAGAGQIGHLCFSGKSAILAGLAAFLQDFSNEASF